MAFRLRDYKHWQYLLSRERNIGSGEGVISLPETMARGFAERCQSATSLARIVF